MDIKIIVDSCCDLTPELSEKLGAVTVPLTLTLGDDVFVDNETLDLSDYMEKMKAYTGRIGSSFPSATLFKEAFLNAKNSFAVTLSGNLSGCYGSAMLGKTMAEEEDADASVYVFDSKSACAGETLIALKIWKLLDEQRDKQSIISSIENFIKRMKTYFVLENIDTLVKNGRVNKITGKIISVLNIKPIMGSDGDGNIALFSHARGQKQIIEKLTDTIEKSGIKTNGETMVISHCNNIGLAEKLKNAIDRRYHFNEILIVPTNGLSSMYSNDKGVIIAF